VLYEHLRGRPDDRPPPAFGPAGIRSGTRLRIHEPSSDFLLRVRRLVPYRTVRVKYGTVQY
jgi:hypothetical protein